MTGQFVYRSAATAGQPFKQLIVRDDFRGAAGVDLNGRSTPHGNKPWIATTGSWATTGNSSLKTAGNTGENIAVVDVGVTDVIVQAQILANSDGLLVANSNAARNSYWLLWVNVGSTLRRIYLMNNDNAYGGPELYSFDGGLPQNGDIFTFQVQGDSMIVKRNGTVEINVTRPNREFKTQTHHGIRGSVGDLNLTIADFRIISL